LQALHQFAGTHEQDLVAAVDQRVAQAGDQMGFARAGRTEGEQVVSLREPAVGLG
jgi:hypothetical protein